jgi:hypothetical protein
MSISGRITVYEYNCQLVGKLLFCCFMSYLMFYNMLHSSEKPVSTLLRNPLHGFHSVQTGLNSLPYESNKFLQSVLLTILYCLHSPADPQPPDPPEHPRVPRLVLYISIYLSIYPSIHPSIHLSFYSPADPRSPDPPEHLRVPRLVLRAVPPPGTVAPHAGRALTARPRPEEGWGERVDGGRGAVEGRLRVL